MEELHGKYLSFFLKGEEYAINISQIIEIIGMQAITQIPKTPDSIKGVINLRGKIIPIMDLRLKFGMEEKEYDERTCTIVVEIERDGEQRQVGLIVDTVNEVTNIENIDAPPTYDEQGYEKFILGIGKLKERVIMILDIKDVISTADADIANAATGKVEAKEEAKENYNNFKSKIESKCRNHNLNNTKN